MDVLLDCEESQEVCKAFRERGHEAYSCDLLPCSGGHPEWHIQADAIETLWGHDWDLVIAFPPCTRLTNSGVRWLNERNLWDELKSAIKFFKEFQRWHNQTGKPLSIENPIPHKYARDGFYTSTNEWVEGIGNYTQLIQPWQFGHPETKATCLWLYNLPKLEPTNIVEGREQRIWKMSPGAERSKERSKTYPGIARAMATRWSEVLLPKEFEVNAKHTERV